MNEAAGGFVGRKMGLWEFIWAAAAVCLALILAAGNIGGPLLMDDGPEKLGLTIFAVIASLLVITGQFAIACHYKAGNIPVAFVALVIWGTFSYCEIAGAAKTFSTLGARTAAPTVRMIEEANEASSQLAAEKAHLIVIQAAAVKELDTLKLRNLKRQEDESRTKIMEISPRTFKAHVVPTNGTFSGREIEWCVGIWVAVQGLLMVAFAGRDQAGREPPRAALARHEPPIETIEKSSKASQDAGSDEPGASQVRARCEPPRLIIDNAEPDPGFDEEVLSHHRAGLSIRQISKEMGCGRTRIKNIIDGSVPRLGPLASTIMGRLRTPPSA